jgi:hypothetical protein
LQVRKKHFNDDKMASNDRIQKGVKQAARELGINMLAAEHLCCESIKDGNKGRHDSHHPKQSFAVISITDPGDDIIREFHYGGEGKKDIVVYRTEEEDLKYAREYPKEDNYPVMFPWWEGDGSLASFIVKYVKNCEKNHQDPFRVIYQTALQAKRAPTNDGIKRFSVLLTTNKIDLSIVPRRTAGKIARFRKETKERTEEGSIYSEEEGLQHKSCADDSLVGNSDKDDEDDDGKRSSFLSVVSPNDNHVKYSSSESSSFLRSVPRRVTVHRSMLERRSKMNDSKLGGVRQICLSLSETAKCMWRYRYNESLPVLCTDYLSTDGCSGWVTSFDQFPMDRSAIKYPPSSAMDKLVTTKNGTVVGHHDKRNAKRAFLWWIVLCVPTTDNLIRWMELTLAGSEQVEMYLDTECRYLFATIGKFSKERFYVRYKDRRCWMTSEREEK